MSLVFTITVKPGKPTAVVMAQHYERHKRGVASGLSLEAEIIMAKSKDLVPVDTGALRSSGHVRKPRTVGDYLVVELGYGGVAVGYAIPVHERLDVHHPVGQAKYLEIPFKAAQPGLATRVMVRARMSGTVGAAGGGVGAA